MIPFGGSFKIAYAPDLDTYGSGNNGGGTGQGGSGIGSSAYAGRSATEMQISFDAIPMADGLKIGASYFERDEQGAATKRDADAESGAYYATYAVGNISLGYSKAYNQLLVADSANTGTDYYEQTNSSIAYSINDDLSVSYEVEKSEELVLIQLQQL